MRLHYLQRSDPSQALESDSVMEAATIPGSLSPMSIATGAVNALFRFKPFFNFAASQAKSMIVKRGTEIGYPWAPELARLQLHDWPSELEAVQNQALTYPDYYLKPFHAYETGNLSWDAALEVELAAKSVHANVFDPERKKLDPNGDVRLRDGYHEKLLSMLKIRPTNILDIGCATGLSTFGLYEIFPGAQVVGVDLSPYFLSVANFWVKEKQSEEERIGAVEFLHAAGEDTGLPSGSLDLVSLSLVCHELPRSATKQIIEEAHRLLKQGGALAIMEMNPYSPLLQKMVNNIFAFTAFKSTEPYFDDYRTFCIEKAIEERGFQYPSQLECSPRHRTIVAHKK
ncbi:hypothetical protein GOP47_0012856 [Adiantum capillus-veneris]|uniref:Methyltransferase type 11 domain-containing protein n=1 Tax=Adiantum capillus-veneris TaxID=13818 RepID=A0A9D4URH1_ADICA|nr:hypothetical protein GOP47_0012856 [Adiantum capillus-veneris]